MHVADSQILSRLFPWIFTNVTSRCVTTLQKTALNRLQLKVDKLKRLKASIFYNVGLKKSAFEKIDISKNK